MPRRAPFVCFVLPVAALSAAESREMARRHTRAAAINYFDRDPHWRRRRLGVTPLVYDETSGKAWRRTARGWFECNWAPPQPGAAAPAAGAAPYWMRD